jgi:hypothetical protein
MKSYAFTLLLLVLAFSGCRGPDLPGPILSEAILSEVAKAAEEKDMEYLYADAAYWHPNARGYQDGIQSLIKSDSTYGILAVGDEAVYFLTTGSKTVYLGKDKYFALLPTTLPEGESLGSYTVAKRIPLTDIESAYADTFKNGKLLVLVSGDGDYDTFEISWDGRWVDAKMAQLFADTINAKKRKEPIPTIVEIWEAYHSEQQ